MSLAKEVRYETEDDIADPWAALADRYGRVRNDSEQICAPLETEDYVIQTMPDVSPPKWHLAHTTWFFEQFLLRPFVNGYQVFHPAYDNLFNSYYVTHGTPYPRPQRGLLARPSVAEVYRYRVHVDAAMGALLDDAEHHPRAADIHQRVELGLHHEQQHQELLLTDIKHIFAHNPLAPVYRAVELPTAAVPALSWQDFDGGQAEIGFSGDDFAYDNERPRHTVYLQPFALASRPVTNGEYLEFMQDGGYSQPQHWLSDGWATLQQEHWQAPGYWTRRDDEWHHTTLGGLQPVDPHAPVCHISLYEAQAYASWCGKRLPTEAEWEHAAAPATIEGNLRDRGLLQPAADPGGPGLRQLYGDAWEWTASAYSAYPGFKPLGGTLGEYNGKFMSSQMVLRGGSCATAGDHIRPSYRNFFFPGDRWQFSGLRLADDL